MFPQWTNLENAAYPETDSSHFQIAADVAVVDLQQTLMDLKVGWNLLSPSFP